MGFILTEKTRKYYMSKSILESFNAIAKNKPNASSYICFAEAIRGKKIKRSTLRRWFNKLVSKDDYGDGEREGTFEYLFSLSQSE